MNWLFKSNTSGLRDRVESSLSYFNASERATNEMYSEVDWSTRRKLEAKKKLTKAEKSTLFWINAQISGYEVQSALNLRLARQFDATLPEELRNYW